MEPEWQNFATNFNRWAVTRYDINQNFIYTSEFDLKLHLLLTRLCTLCIKCDSFVKTKNFTSPQGLSAGFGVNTMDLVKEISFTPQLIDEYIKAL